MTTAHRPTWKAAVGQGSDNGGWSAGGAVSHLRSVLDAPAHTQLKVRRSLDPSGDAEEQDGDNHHHRSNHRSARLRASLQAILAAEQTSKASIQERIGKRQIDPAIEERAQQKLLTNTAEIDMERIKAKYDDSDIEDNDEDDDDEKDNNKEESDLDDDDDDEDGDGGSDDADDDDEDDEAALQAELAKIRAEREAAKQKAEAEETAEQEEAAAVLGNPLLSRGAATVANAASGKLKRRWNDDVVFRNQAAKVGTTSAPPKRFNNDTVRNDFHKRFLNKFIR
jgi:protein CWC15